MIYVSVYATYLLSAYCILGIVLILEESIMKRKVVMISVSEANYLAAEFSNCVPKYPGVNSERRCRIC